MKKTFAVAMLLTVAAIAYATQGQKQRDDLPPCILTNTCGMTGGN